NGTGLILYEVYRSNNFLARNRTRLAATRSGAFCRGPRVLETCLQLVPHLPHHSRCEDAVVGSKEFAHSLRFLACERPKRPGQRLDDHVIPVGLPDLAHGQCSPGVAAAATGRHIERHRADHRHPPPPAVGRNRPSMHDLVFDLAFPPGRPRKVTSKSITLAPTRHTFAEFL